MDELENKLGAILGDPETMAKIMDFAQSLGQPEREKPSPPKEPPVMPDIDPSLLKKLSGIAGHSSIDQNQQTLLQALRPYLNANRISKLERAMRAAKMAGMAGIFLNASSGR